MVEAELLYFAISKTPEPEFNNKTIKDVDKRIPEVEGAAQLV